MDLAKMSTTSFTVECDFNSAVYGKVMELEVEEIDCELGGRNRLYSLRLVYTRADGNLGIQQRSMRIDVKGMSIAAITLLALAKFSDVLSEERASATE